MRAFEQLANLGLRPPANAVGTQFVGKLRLPDRNFEGCGHALIAAGGVDPKPLRVSSSENCDHPRFNLGGDPWRLTARHMA